MDDNLKDYLLGIVIINYRTPEMTINCLSSLLPGLQGVDCKVVVVDNSSGDDSCALIGRWLQQHDTNELVKLVESEFNGGFSYGNNLGITASPVFDASTCVAYMKLETADTVGEIKHTIVREALKHTRLGPYLEITTIGDMPAGTGLGSRGSLAVGVLNAPYTCKGEISNLSKLADLACHGEFNINATQGNCSSRRVRSALRIFLE